MEVGDLVLTADRIAFADYLSDDELGEVLHHSEVAEEHMRAQVRTEYGGDDDGDGRD